MIIIPRFTALKAQTCIYSALILLRWKECTIWTTSFRLAALSFATFTLVLPTFTTSVTLDVVQLRIFLVLKGALVNKITLKGGKILLGDVPIELERRQHQSSIQLKPI